MKKVENRFKLKSGYEISRDNRCAEEGRDRGQL